MRTINPTKEGAVAPQGQDIIEKSKGVIDKMKELKPELVKKVLAIVGGGALAIAGGMYAIDTFLGKDQNAAAPTFPSTPVTEPQGQTETPPVVVDNNKNNSNNSTNSELNPDTRYVAESISEAEQKRLIAIIEKHGYTNVQFMGTDSTGVSSFFSKKGGKTHYVDYKDGEFTSSIQNSKTYEFDYVESW